MNTYFRHLMQIAQKAEKQRPSINWYNYYKSAHYDEKRSELLAHLENAANWKFKGTKPFINSLSPGCHICGEGNWSCLFITGICNASCFYCPAAQDLDGMPQTQSLLFPTESGYVNYINQFEFKGVSFSGGEPLLFFDRTRNYLEAVRKGCDPSVYIWMYTNGILGTDEKFKILADAGLNEIRFDLGAVNYNPKVLKNAAKYIPNVTVEIPAIPEHKERLFELLPVLCDYGVSNLNLHQLRLTSYNAGKLLKNPYTYLRFEQPVVIESELAGLDTMRYVNEKKIPIGVNYCNFQFKNRFQKAGYRRIMAAQLKKNDEEVTENGYLRMIRIVDENEQHLVSLDELISRFNEVDKLIVSYSGRVLNNLEKNENAQKMKIGEVDYPVKEGYVSKPITLTGNQIHDFVKMIQNRGIYIPDDPMLFEAWRNEFIEEGMRDYM